MLTKKDLMKLESLVYLLSFSKSGSKRNVAESLGISTDTMNKYIAELENSLGFKLINSTNRGSALTPQAKEILPLADTLKSILREMEFIAKSGHEVSGVVRIGIHDGITAPIFNTDVTELYKKYPGIKIETTIKNIADAAEINDEDVDFVISYIEPSGGNKVVCETREISCGFFASPRYLQEFGMPYDLEDLLSNHRFCLNLNNVKYIKGLDEISKDIRHISYQSNSTYSTFLMAHSGAEIGVFPKGYDMPSLINISNVINGNIPQLSYKLYLIANKNTKDIPKIRAVLDYLKQEIRRMK